ncbi:MAG: orotidine 5'-phosphate decarboxylase [Clostridia bacterium]|nr:orotidine 5'-phosphate decarboxylase [Clostridia bacterium]
MSVSYLLERIKNCGAPIAVDLGEAILNIPCDEKRNERVKTVIDATASRAAAFYIDISLFNNTAAEHGFLYDSLRYAKEKGAYIILDFKALSYSEEVKKCMEDSAACDAVTACAYLGVEYIQPLVFAANKFSKSVFLYLNTEDSSGFSAFSDLIQLLAGQAFGTAKYSNIGVFLKNADDAAKVREKLQNCMIITKASKISSDIVDCFDDEGNGALAIVSLLKQGKEFDFENLYVDSRRAAERNVRAINKTLFRKSTVIQI